MEDSGTYETLVYVTSKAVTLLIFVISWFISSLQLCYSYYPQLTLMVMTLVMGYLGYRMMIRIIRSYLRMLWRLLKLLLFLVTVGLCFVVYIRGNNFFDHDVPYLQKVFNDYSQGSINEIIQNELNKYMFKSFMNQFIPPFGDESREDYQDYDAKSQKRSKSSTGKSNKKKSTRRKNNKGKKFQKEAKKVMNEYGIEIDESYLDYMNEHFNPDSHGKGDGSFGEKFANNIGDTLDDLGIDLNQVNDFIGRINI